MKQQLRDLYLKDIEDWANENFKDAFQALPSWNTLQWSESTVELKTYLYVRIGSVGTQSSDSGKEAVRDDVFARILISRRMPMGPATAEVFVRFGTKNTNWDQWKGYAPEETILEEPFETACGGSGRFGTYRMPHIIRYYLLASGRVEKIADICWPQTWNFLKEHFRDACQSYRTFYKIKAKSSSLKTQSIVQHALCVHTAGKRSYPRTSDTQEPQAKRRKTMKITSPQSQILATIESFKAELFDAQSSVKKLVKMANEEKDKNQILQRTMAGATKQLEKQTLKLQSETMEQRKQRAKLEDTIQQSVMAERRAKESQEEKQQMIENLQDLLAKETEKRKAADKRAGDAVKELEDVRRIVGRAIKPRQRRSSVIVKTEPE